MFYTTELEKHILLEPAETCNRLQIISGFTDCDRIATHVIELVDGCKEGKYQKCEQIDMILGMYRSISIKKHNELKHLISYTLETNKKNPKFNLYYISTNAEVHSKVYTWFVDDTPTLSFVGSANYSMEAFKRRRECMSDSNPELTAKYFETLKTDTVNCLSVGDNYKFNKSNTPIVESDPDSFDYVFYDKQLPIGEITISLLPTRGDIGYCSSINWGIRRNGTPRNPNQAYIPYNKHDRVEGFFPDR